MLLRTALTFVLLRSAPVSAASLPCIALDGDVIRAGDVGRALRMSVIEEDAVIGYSPVAGQRRIIPWRDITRVLTGNSSTSVPHALEGICVERRASVLEEEMVLTALKEALSGRDAQIHLVDFSRLRLPPGRVRFEVALLPRGGATSESVIWRGVHVDSNQRKTAVWASVKVSVSGCSVIATRDLSLEKPLTPDMFERNQLRVLPGDPRERFCELNIIGKRLRRSVHVGEPIDIRYLDEEYAVVRGESVRVEVGTKRARVVLGGKAESSARVGQRVAFQTELSKRPFMGVVLAKGIISVELPN